jgi:hypothetical protein
MNRHRHKWISRKHVPIKYTLFILWALSFSAHGEAPVEEISPSYVGAEGCGMCHRDQYIDWQKSKHAKVFELLKPGERISAKKKAKLDPDKDYTTDTKCLKCHTTGFREPGGFTSITDTPTRIGIGCEMCHGPGSEYRKVHKQKRAEFTRSDVIAAGQKYGSADETVCHRCHEHEDTPMQPKIDDKYKFDLAERLKNTRAYHKHYTGLHPLQ